MSRKLHEIHVIFGRQAVKAYLNKESSIPRLASLGAVQNFQFATVQEANAFCEGVEAATGWQDVIATQ